MYDTIIIGAGVAGLTSAIYAQRRAMKTLIISKDLGGQVNLTTEIENYPGFENISAFDLIDRIVNQVKKLGVEIKIEAVLKIEKNKDGSFTINGENGSYQTKTIILALGLLPRRLDIPGEEKFAGRGVSYCANCDGPLYKGKTIAVVGGGNSALDAAEYLSNLAEKVFLIHRRDSFKAFEEIVQEVKSKKNIEIILNSEVLELSGENKLQTAKILNKKTGKETQIAIDGIFIEVGRTASTKLVEGLVKLDELGQIIVNQDGATSQPGIFAGGDITNGKIKQLTVACGSGTIATLSAYQYLHRGAQNFADYGKSK